MQSINAKNSKNYPQAKQHGRNALILTVINIIFTLCLSLLIIGLTVGLTCANPANSYYSYSYSYSKYKILVYPYIEGTRCSIKQKYQLQYRWLRLLLKRETETKLLQCHCTLILNTFMVNNCCGSYTYIYINIMIVTL
jgi:hypothetical protein